MPIVQRFTYTNSTSAKVRVILEPWAEEFRVRPGQVVEVVVDADAPGCIELEQKTACFIIYGYTGSTVELFSDGKEMVPFTEE